MTNRSQPNETFHFKMTRLLSSNFTQNHTHETPLTGGPILGGAAIETMHDRYDAYLQLMPTERAEYNKKRLVNFPELMRILNSVERWGYCPDEMYVIQQSKGLL